MFVFLAGLSAVVLAMVAVRVAKTESLDYYNLVWNLFLAWVPLAFAFVVYEGANRGMRRLWLVSFGALWLLFFPNAPYLMTDMKYLRELDGAPLWYDVTMTVLAAATGLALGFISLFLIHSVARRYIGPGWAWVGVSAVLALSSVGVFLGRFARFNSWDAFTDPAPILNEVAKGATNPTNYPKVVAVTLVFGGFLIVTYGVFYAVARFATARDESARL